MNAADAFMTDDDLGGRAEIKFFTCNFPPAFPESSLSVIHGGYLAPEALQDDAVMHGSAAAPQSHPF